MREETIREQEDAFKEYLGRHGLKVTPQRMRILDVFLRRRGHLTSEELHNLARQEDPSLGQATVYRTLKLLADSGLAREVDFSDGAVRYERAADQEHHDHLICERCRRTVEVADERIERLQEELAREHGFLLTGHSMYLYGLCPACRSEDDESRE